MDKFQNKFYDPIAQVEYETSDELIVSQDTGEVIPVARVNATSKGPHYWRLWLRELLASLGKLNEHYIDVLCFLLENIQPGDNICYCTQDEISEGTALSRSTVIRALKQLSEAGLLRKLKNGKYMVNPRIMVFDLQEGNKQQNILIRVYDGAEAVASGQKKKKLKNKSIRQNVNKRKEEKGCDVNESRS